jgi:hypothetical protein
MNPYVISAKFAAYVWYQQQNPQKTSSDAMSFARQNWNTFLPCSHKGLGRLLAKIADSKVSEIGNSTKSRSNIPEKTRPVSSSRMGF